MESKGTATRARTQQESKVVRRAGRPSDVEGDLLIGGVVDGLADRLRLRIVALYLLHRRVRALRHAERKIEEGRRGEGGEGGRGFKGWKAPESVVMIRDWSGQGRPEAAADDKWVSGLAQRCGSSPSPLQTLRQKKRGFVRVVLLLVSPS